MIEFGKALYSSNCSAETIRMFLKKLRVAMVIERYRRSMKALPVREVKQVEMPPNVKEVLSESSNQRIILQYLRSELYYLLVSFVPNEVDIVTTKLQLLECDENKVQLIPLDNVSLLS